MARHCRADGDRNPRHDRPLHGGLREPEFEAAGEFVKLKGAALSRFLLRKQGLHWDGVPAPQARLEDLSEAAVDRFREEARRSGRLDAALLAEPTPVMIDRLHLRERSRLKRAALLLFHPDPEVFFTGAYVKIGFFRNDVDLLYHDEIHGDLFTQVARTMDLLLTKYLRAGIRYEGVRRVEEFPMPRSALREALLNAVVHKDYASGATIQISVYDDKLMIWNPGQLPPDWTAEDLLAKHESKPFNPDVADAFFRAGMVESWGRGIELILGECRRVGVPAPELSFKRSGFWGGLPLSARPPGRDPCAENRRGDRRGTEHRHRNQQRTDTETDTETSTETGTEAARSRARAYPRAARGAPGHDDAGAGGSRGAVPRWRPPPPGAPEIGRPRPSRRSHQGRALGGARLSAGGRSTGAVGNHSGKHQPFTPLVPARGRHPRGPRRSTGESPR